MVEWLKKGVKESVMKAVRRVDACILLQTIIACRNIRVYLYKNGEQNQQPPLLHPTHKITTIMSDCLDVESHLKVVFGYYYSIEQKKMGCEHSQLKELPLNQQQQHQQRCEEDKVMAVLEEVNEGEEIIQQRNISYDQSKENESGVKSKEKKGKHHVQLEEDGKMKVKKARNYRIKPQHEKFIENIIESNRGKATTEYPAQNQKTPTLKKNASASVHSKLECIQPKPATNQTVEHKAEPGVKEGKPVLCQKQLERRLNGMLHKIDEEREAGVGLAIDLELLDSNATLQL